MQKAERGFRHDELARLLTNRLAAFGPAAVRDMRAWSGLTRLSEAAERLHVSPPVG